MKSLIASTGLLLLIGVCLPAVCSGHEKPNIVLIFADDMGYGDVSCLNRNAKFKTPHLDAMAAGGLTLTDAHTSSSVCTPSRYSLLTGRYCWRTRMRRGVLGGYSGALIQQGQETVASILQQRGYNTACIGKWHLGMNFPTTDGKRPGQKGGGTIRYLDGKAIHDKDEEMTSNVAWSGKIKRSPITNGFDFFFGINGSLDMPPYVYIENDRFTGVPTKVKSFHRPGMAHADFEAVNVLPELTEKVVSFIDDQDGSEPFFVYFPMTGPHTPIVPTSEFQGKSGIGPYGDFCMQVDHHVGQVMQALKRKGMNQNTLVLFSADNGCEVHAYQQYRDSGHNSSGHFRGVKRDLWEGGHRVPTFAHWPALIKPGSVSDETICLTDFLPTIAEIVGYLPPDDVGEDGVSLMPLFKGQEIDRPLREATIHHSLSGQFAIRAGNWVLIDSPSGSDRRNEPQWYTQRRGYLPHDQLGELYDLSIDPEQKKNVYAQQTERAQRLKKLLEKCKSESSRISAQE